MARMSQRGQAQARVLALFRGSKGCPDPKPRTRNTRINVRWTAPTAFPSPLRWRRDPGPILIGDEAARPLSSYAVVQVGALRLAARCWPPCDYVTPAKRGMASGGVWSSATT